MSRGIPGEGPSADSRYTNDLSLGHYPVLTLTEFALHAWDIRSRLRPGARLVPESVRALVQYLPPRLAWSHPGGVAGGPEAAQAGPVRSRWELPQGVPSHYDIIVADGVGRVEPASRAVADVTFRGEARPSCCHTHEAKRRLSP